MKYRNFWCFCDGEEDSNLWRLFRAVHAGTDSERAAKVKYGLLLLKSQDKVSARFVKYIRNSIYELRTLYNGNIFRVFFIFDDGNIVVLLNGFQKKTQKTPESEIELAIKIKESYYADKRSSD